PSTSTSSTKPRAPRPGWRSSSARTRRARWRGASSWPSRAVDASTPAGRKVDELLDGKGQLPPGRQRVHADGGDPLQPPVAAPVGGHHPDWKAVAWIQRLAAQPGGQKQPAGLLDREAAVVAGDRSDVD